MKEYHEVMNTIKEFTAEDAMVIVGTVIEEAMEDRLRVTMIATGLGGAVVATRRPPKLEVLETVVERTGTDNVGMRSPRRSITRSSTSPPSRAAGIRRASQRRRSIHRRSPRSCASRRTDEAAGLRARRGIRPRG